MKRIFLSGLAAFLLAACSGSGKGLHFEDVAVNDPKGQPLLALRRDGHLSAGGRALGAFDGAGGIRTAKGVLVGRLNDEGLVEDGQGKAFASMDDSGWISDRNGLRLGWSRDGEWMNGALKTGYRLQPPGSKAARAMNLALYLYFSSELSGAQVPSH